MNRLTHERSNGIKSGYWSPNKKQDLVDRLARYENTGLEPEEITTGAMSKNQFEKICIAVKECCENEYPKFANDRYYKILDAMKTCVWVQLTIHKGVYTSEQVCELLEIAEEVATRKIKDKNE